MYRGKVSIPGISVMGDSLVPSLSSISIVTHLIYVYISSTDSIRDHHTLQDTPLRSVQTVNSTAFTPPTSRDLVTALSPRYPNPEIRMVLTPLARATEMAPVASPLILPVDRSNSSVSSAANSPPWSASYPPPLRKNSTGSFSKLSDFRLDPEGDDEEEGNGVEGVRHVVLSVDAQ
jgi:hypothetical protein